MEKKYMEFNLNHSIKVKLMDKGYEHLANQHNRFLGRIPNWEKRNAEYYRNRADEQGYTKFQGWQFIELFGSVTGIIYHGYYDINILIKTNNDLATSNQPTRPADFRHGG